MMRSHTTALVASSIWMFVGSLMAQQTPSPSPYVVGNAFGMPMTPNPAGTFNPISPNVKPDGKHVQTETAAQAGNDGLVIMKDGTKYVSSVVNGGVSRIRPKQAAELLAQNIPTGASMCYDSGANQLVIPMNANNALAFVSLK